MFFSGSYVALITPWTKDLSDIDYGALKDLIEWQMASGTDGVLPAGTTGESATLTHKEQHRLVEETVRIVAGRAKVLAGAGSNSTAEAASLAERAKNAGADGILVITPYYNRPTPEGLYRHFGTVAEKCDLPMMMYNVPSRTGTNMLPQTVARIAKAYPSIVCVKEASGSVDQASQIIDLTGGKFGVMSGDDSLALPTIAVGGDGVVSVVANLAPAETRQMTAAALAGDYATARELHYRLYPLMKACFVETNPAPTKTALTMLGRIDGGMRLPMTPLQPENEEIMRAALRKVGLVR
ncbi:MAG: 4-hydroxy-tetrahydrodipicolinate synthase [Planctomycetota bacterium]|jgi:4-hydroxy-tetrahydrodipicolinate synthase|nr:4-hydroxy-tetrahydrodipicolinate synthase [Planctomycetota bacterium]